MTLSGTNTYVVDLRAGSAGVAVIDPGPSPSDGHERHLRAILECVRQATAGGEVSVLLTHHHTDHSGGAPGLLRELTKAGYRPRLFGAGGEAMPDSLGQLRVIPTPGHTQDSVAFLFEQGHHRALFSGDTLLGGSSSFIAHPDGNLTNYLASLERLSSVLAADCATVLAPGHGVQGLDAADAVRDYQEHREARLNQVREVLEALGPQAGVNDVVDAVYAEINPELRPAVEAVVKAQIEHLRG